jgi:hypothetical protein
LEAWNTKEAILFSSGVITLVLPISSKLYFHASVEIEAMPIMKDATRSESEIIIEGVLRL